MPYSQSSSKLPPGSVLDSQFAPRETAVRVRVQGMETIVKRELHCIARHAKTAFSNLQKLVILLTYGRQEENESKQTGMTEKHEDEDPSLETEDMFEVNYTVPVTVASDSTEFEEPGRTYPRPSDNV